MDAGGPPPSYQESRAKSDEARPPPLHQDGPPMKAQKQDATSYPGKASSPSSTMGQYNTMDFLGNVTGGPHAAAAEALATFSSSVGDSANNSNLYVHVPTSPQIPVPQAPVTQAAPLHGPPFLCPTCNTSYSRLEYLRRHERRHADIRPFSCPCGKSFSRSDVLARHKTKCRVVLSGEAQASPSSNSSSTKTERSQRNVSRSTRGRPSTQSRPRSDRDSFSDLSVDPALSGTASVDPSMQPPPPLEPGVPAHGEGEEGSYAYATSAPAAYPPHIPQPPHVDSDYVHAKTAAHYAQPPSNAHAPMPVRMHDSKVYSHSTPRTGSAPYVSGASAIHPELSARGGAAGMYSSPHQTSGASSPSPTASGSGAYYPSPSHMGEHSSAAHYEGASSVGTQPPTTSNAMYPHSKDLTGRYGMSSASALSPFSNTALSSNVSPYLSAFSCARDMPARVSSPRLGNSNGNSSQGGQSPATSTQPALNEQAASQPPSTQPQPDASQ